MIFFLVSTYSESHWILFSAWILFVFACLTDYWDGILARHQKRTSYWGKLFDPIADKMLLSSLMILLVSLERASAISVSLIIIREFAVTGLRAVAAVDGTIVSASTEGKLKTFSQMFAVGFLMIHYTTLGLPCHEIGTVLLWFSCGVTLWSGSKYFYSYHTQIAQRPPPS